MKTIRFDTQVHDGIIRLPARYKNLETKKIEVTLVLRESQDKKKEKTKRARGLLSKYKNPALIPKEKEAWEMAVKDKHDHR